MTYADLTDRFYYDEKVGRFRFARSCPPRGVKGSLAGAFNPIHKTWQISWKGAPFSMAIALWLWTHQEWPECELMVTGDVSTGLWMHNITKRADLTPKLDELTQELLREYMHYDPTTGGCKWMKVTSPRGVVGVDWFSREQSKHKNVTFLRKSWRKTHLIWLYMTGELPPADKIIDHKDGNPFNNRWVNLRLATLSQNGGNMMSKPGRLLRGVRKAAGGKYTFEVKCQRVKHCGGIYETPEEAHEAYKKLHAELHGTFSVYASRSKPDTQSHPYETT